MLKILDCIIVLLVPQKINLDKENVLIYNSNIANQKQIY